MKTARQIYGHRGIGGEVSGIALVAQDDFSARYDLDRIKGVFSRPSHTLYGKSYAGKILVLNIAKGGVATAWMLKEMRSRNLSPKALLLNYANPIMAQGAMFGGIPLIDRFEKNITTEIKTGDLLTVKPDQGLVIIHDHSDAINYDLS